MASVDAVGYVERYLGAHRTLLEDHSTGEVWMPVTAIFTFANEPSVNSTPAFQATMVSSICRK